MQAKKRYGFLVASFFLVTFIYNGIKWSFDIATDVGVSQRSFTEKTFPILNENTLLSPHVLQKLSSFGEQEYYDEDESSQSPTEKQSTRENIYKHKNCRMDTCFDFKRCQKNGFKIYVYPDTGDKQSLNFKSILSSLRSSVYYTSNPEKACLFVPAYDTLDRDYRSTDYIHKMGEKISSLKHWNNGKNHIIFTLFSGTWPDYLESVGFDIGDAILAKASFSDNFYRPGFDISLPLIGKTHYTMQGPSGILKSNYFPPRRKYVLSFKGKR